MSKQTGEGGSPSPGGPLEGNPFGIAEALLGLACGFLLASLALGAYDAIAHVHGAGTSDGRTVVGLLAVWVGFLGAVVAASLVRVPMSTPPGGDTFGVLGSPLRARRRGSGSVRKDYGFSLRPWPDIPLGIAVGVAAQFLLVPLLELPLQPFVPHLASRLGHPTRQLLGPASAGSTAGLVIVALLVCVGSPIVEELFFRGLVLRGLLWRLRRLGSRLGPAVSIVVTGLFFGLVHFEALQFLGLSGFGMVLGLLAWRTGRLGPSIMAHVAFNTTTVIAFVLVR
ncbi:MAG: CPBP family intramembrane glutamic endopeptidase [Acidimicrobiales bacterium]